MRRSCFAFIVLLCAVSPGASHADPPAVAAPHVVLISFEDEYAAATTLPLFAKALTKNLGWRCTTLTGNADDGIRGLEVLDTADVLVAYIRRRALPPEQMGRIRGYLMSGKPLVALRTSCHAFEVKGKAHEGWVQWPEFGREILGANYTGHCGHDQTTAVSIAKPSSGHPILAGVGPGDWTSTSWLYKVSPVDSKATVLLTGQWKQVREPVAWTRSFGKSRVFFTSLGDAKDFQTPQFQRLLVNALAWAMNREVPADGKN
jgi:type 1 glutamine amidotransferase